MSGGRPVGPMRYRPAGPARVVRGRALAVLVAALLGGLALALGPLAATPAAAHAVVESTSPANGARLAKSPGQLRVTFDEPVQLGSGGTASVLDESGKDVAAGAAVLDSRRTTLTLPLKSGLPRGVYIASWSVVSADTHPVGGSVQFGVGVAAQSGAASTGAEAAAGPSPALTLAVAGAKGLLYLGLVAALGLAPAAALLRVRGLAAARLRRATGTGAAVAAAASGAQIVLQYAWGSAGVAGGPAGAGGGWWAGFPAFLGTPYALWAGVRIVLLALLAAGVAFRWPGRGGVAHEVPSAGEEDVRSGGRGRSWWALSARICVGVAMLATVVVNGHAGAAGPLRFVSTLAHASAAVAWIGGLATLALLLAGEWIRRRPIDLAVGRDRGGAESAESRPHSAGWDPARLPRWSAYAACCVAVIAASGVLQAVPQVRYPAALLSTQYGLILLAKLALVATALVLAGLNRWSLSARSALSRRPGPDRRRKEPTRRGAGSGLRSRARWELGITAAIVVVSGLLSSVTPAGDEWRPQESVTAQAGPYRVRATIAPAKPGPVTVRLEVTPPDGNTRQPKLEAALRQAGSGTAGSGGARTAGSAAGVTGAGGNGGAAGAGGAATAGSGVQRLPVALVYSIPGAIARNRATPVTYISSAVSVPRNGDWVLTVDADAGTFDQYTTDLPFTVR